jgi:hypothetical protein
MSSAGEDLIKKIEAMEIDYERQFRTAFRAINQLSDKSGEPRVNRRQKLVLWIGILIICAMGVYPPWLNLIEIKGFHIQELGRYSWFFRPPNLQIYDVIIDGKDPHEKILTYGEVGTYKVQIDFSRLLIQWVCIAVLTLGFFIHAEE